MPRTRCCPAITRDACKGPIRLHFMHLCFSAGRSSVCTHLQTVQGTLALNAGEWLYLAPETRAQARYLNKAHGCPPLLLCLVPHVFLQQPQRNETQWGKRWLVSLSTGKHEVKYCKLLAKASQRVLWDRSCHRWSQWELCLILLAVVNYCLNNCIILGLNLPRPRRVYYPVLEWQLSYFLFSLLLHW